MGGEIRQHPDHGRLPGHWTASFAQDPPLLSPSLYFLGKWVLFITILCYYINNITSCDSICLLVYFFSSHENMEQHRAGHWPFLFSISSGAFRTVSAPHRPPEKNCPVNRLIEAELRAKILITES